MKLTVVVVIVAVVSLQQGRVLNSFHVPPKSHSRTSPNKFISVHTACTRQAIMAAVVLKDLFRGAVYARGYPLECRAEGNNSREVQLIIDVNECGTKLIKEEDGSLSYEVLLYVQFDKNVQQAIDEQVRVQCSPREITVVGTMGTSNTNPHVGRELHRPGGIKSPSISAIPTLKNSSQDLNCWMDIFKGRIPDIQPITEFVNVGEEVTMLIQIREKPGTVTKVTNCIAHDGAKELQQALIDENGCSVDPSILPDLKVKFNQKTGLKMVYATFMAFKFPDRDSLHLECNVLICNDSCPLFPCKTRTGQKRAERSVSGQIFHSFPGEVVFNSVEVKAPAVEIGTSLKRQSSELVSVHSNIDQVCLTPTKMIVTVSITLVVLVIAVIISICTCVRAQELQKKVRLQVGLAYGRVVNL
ncbi:cuticlin-4-like [Tachypleus tridentatus]|uniref:cuticlin-4-like n=1 Tax=Tachypleus tridentatus TaxID=6853 RepID=UPI003FD0515E